MLIIRHQPSKRTPPIVMSSKGRHVVGHLRPLPRQSMALERNLGDQQTNQNPDLIYPNDILILCIIQGKNTHWCGYRRGLCWGWKQLTGNMVTSTVAVTSTANSIPPIPWSALQHWLDKTIIVNPQDFNTTPYILASKKRNQSPQRAIKFMPRRCHLSSVSAMVSTVKVSGMLNPKHKKLSV